MGALRVESTDMDSIELFVVASKTVTLVCGGLVTLMAYRAYQRTASPALRSLAVGLCLVTAGALIAGALHQVVGAPLATGVAVQSAFTATGFAFLAYSLYAQSRPTVEAVGPDRRADT